MDDPRTGTWEPTYYALISNQASRATAHVAVWLQDNASDILLSLGVALVLVGVGLGVRWVYRRWYGLRRALWWPKRVILWPLVQLRRLHKRWSTQNQGKKMAKWKKGRMADMFLGTIHAAQEEGVLSPQEAKAYRTKIGEALNLTDLLGLKYHPRAVRRRLEKNVDNLTGPKQPIPGPKPGDKVVSLDHDFLARRKARKTAS